jgi:FkbM family methyltransferase
LSRIEYLIKFTLLWCRDLISDTRISDSETLKILYDKLDRRVSGKTEVELHGFELIIDSSEGIGEQIIRGHEEEVISNFISKIDEGDIVLDIGAHFGLFSMTAGQKTGNTGKVYSFEPHPNNYDVLTTNIDRNELHNIKSFQSAIGETPGSTTLVTNENFSGRSFIKEVGSERDRTFTDKVIEEITVDIDSIDHFINENSIEQIDIVKVDVEGAELEVLLGAASSFDKVGCFLIELHGNHKKEYLSEMFSLMTTYGKVTDLNENQITYGNFRVQELVKRNNTDTSHFYFKPD